MQGTQGIAQHVQIHTNEHLSLIEALVLVQCLTSMVGVYSEHIVSFNYRVNLIKQSTDCLNNYLATDMAVEVWCS